MQMHKKRCVYCGVEGQKLTRDHVFPRGLFPPVTTALKVQRLTVAACELCNNSFSDDEAHFRSVVTLAGHVTESTSRVFHEKVMRSFDGLDGRRRLFDLVELTERVTVDGEVRLKIYPARDERVLRVVRKCVIGLTYTHGLSSALPDIRVWADVLRYALPTDMEAELRFRGSEPEVVEYAFLEKPFEGIDVVWLIKFFRRATFIASVSSAESHPDRSGKAND
jgi:hypothetical protein